MLLNDCGLRDEKKRLAILLGSSMREANKPTPEQYERSPRVVEKAALAIIVAGALLIAVSLYLFVILSPT